MAVKMLKTWDEQTIKTKVIGHRNAMNTDWPIEAYLRRLEPRGYAVTTLWNGTTTGHREFKTRREAEAYFDAM